MITNNPKDQREATLGDVLEALNGIQNNLEEISVWQRISGADKVRGLLHSSLDTPEKKLVYYNSDGKSTRELGALVNMDNTTVGVYWRSWHKLGLMKTEKVKGGGNRYLKAFEPEDYGIAVPKKNGKEKQSKVIEPAQSTLAVADTAPSTPVGGNGQ